MKLHQAQEFNKLNNLIRSKNLSVEEKQHLESFYSINFDDFYTETGQFAMYQELEMSNDCIDVHEDISYTKDMVSLHSHTFYEMLFIRNGNLQYLIGDTRYQLQKNDIIFLPPGISHRPLFLEELTIPYHRTVIWVNSTYFEQCQKQLLQFEQTPQSTNFKLPYIIRISGTLFNHIEQIIDFLLYEKNQQRPGSNFFCMNLYGQLLCLFYRSFIYQNQTMAQPETTSLLDKIMNYIENHFADVISLKSTAEKFHVSPSVISHLFKDQMDVSFYRVVTQRRLIESKKYIIGGLPLKSIPELCGFSDYSTFYKAFLKEYGVSPKQLKNRERIQPQ